MSTLINFFQQGGPFMYPILIVFALGLAIAIERWSYLTLSGAANRALWNFFVEFRDDRFGVAVIQFREDVGAVVAREVLDRLVARAEKQMD